MTGFPKHNSSTAHNRRVTISDVSDALGVTKSTVSRALNGYPDISDQTRNRVAQMAKKLGYHPLSHAQAIKTGRIRSLGLVVQTGDHDGAQPFLADFLAGISHAATSEGWTLTLASSENEAGTLTMLNTLLRERKADGFILPRTIMDDARVNLLRASQTPFVLFGRPDDETGCAWFDILGETAMEQAVERLFKLGHRRIAFVNGGLCYTYSKIRRAGFIKGMANVGLQLDPALMTESAVDAKTGERAAMTLLQCAAPPTAIVYAVDIGALGLYRAAAQLGLEVGQDISVIAYDGIPEGAYLTPPLSTFSVRYREAGEKLAHLLIRRVRGEPPEELRETALADFLDKGSAGPPRKTPDQIAKTIRDTLGPNLHYGRKDQ